MKLESDVEELGEQATLHSIFGTQYLWYCLFYSLVAKDCQYPRDPMQPAIKKKKQGTLHSIDYSYWYFLEKII